MREARVAVGGDRVALGGGGNLADDQRRQQLPGVRFDAQGVGGALGVEKGARAEEVVALGRGTAVLDQLSPGGGRAHPRTSAAAARNSSGSTAQISRSKRSPPRSSWSSRV